MKNPVVHFEIIVDDMARATLFYETVFNVTLSDQCGPIGQATRSFPSDMTSYGVAGALVQMDGFTAGGNSSILYFNCDDCAVEESRVEGAGGKVTQAKTSIAEHGYYSLAVDTEGNIFGLHSNK